jgi:hypothetical protein
MFSTQSEQYASLGVVKDHQKMKGCMIAAARVRRSVPGMTTLAKPVDHVAGMC